MHIINESQVSEEHRKSPKGEYELFRKHISLALGGVKDVGVWGGGHPFDVELVKIPAGKKNYPFHSHAAQTEYYIVISGSGILNHGDGVTQPVKAGDHVILSPGEAHELVNNSEGDLVYFVLADHHRADVTSYPHTGKRQIKPEYRCVRVTEADYYEGEE